MMKTETCVRELATGTDAGKRPPLSKVDIANTLDCACK